MNSAFGDGLTQEQITASLGNRKADLLIKMIPTVVTTETLEKGQKPTIEFRLFDSGTNQSFSHVTYYVIVEKDGKKLLYDLFHDHEGTAQKSAGFLPAQGRGEGVSQQVQVPLHGKFAPALRNTRWTRE